MNPHWWGQNLQQSRQPEMGQLMLWIPSLIWAAVAPGTTSPAAETSPAREWFSPSAKLPETVAPGERRPANLPWDRRGQGKGWAVTPAPPTTAERRSTAPSCSLYWWPWCFRTKHTLFLLKYFPPSSRKAAFPPSRHSWFLQSLTTAGQHVFKDNCFV